MNFEKLLATFDMGLCADQLQREALFDLALLFVEIDGVETDEEKAFIQQWVDECEWNSPISKAEFRDQAIVRCKAAIKHGSVESFIKEKAALLANTPVKNCALALANDIAMADGELAEDEAKALGFLSKYLQ